MGRDDSPIRGTEYGDRSCDVVQGSEMGLGIATDGVCGIGVGSCVYSAETSVLTSGRSWNKLLCFLSLFSLSKPIRGPNRAWTALSGVNRHVYSVDLQLLPRMPAFWVLRLGSTEGSVLGLPVGLTGEPKRSLNIFAPCLDCMPRVLIR